MTEKNTILLIGLGNPILGDDGVGWRVVEEVEKVWRTGHAHDGRDVEFKYLSLGGLALMEQMEGFDNVIVVDSMLTGSRPNGTIYSLPLSSLPDFSAGHTTAIHDTSLTSALEIGRRMEMALPTDVWVVAVETEFVVDFSEELSPEVETIVPTVVELVLKMLLEDFREEKIYDLT